jgi:peptide/nickel transport system permease protein
MLNRQAAGRRPRFEQSYLGVGVQPPDASWGSMLLHSRTYVTKAPWLVITPGFFIFVTILSIFLLADGLRDALDRG